MYACVYVCVCMYVCVYECMYICTYICTYILYNIYQLMKEGSNIHHFEMEHKINCNPFLQFVSVLVMFQLT